MSFSVSLRVSRRLARSCLESRPTQFFIALVCFPTIVRYPLAFRRALTSPEPRLITYRIPSGLYGLSFGTNRMRLTPT
ncbi:hypothetical protein HYPSUDRAFT_36512 [Hypholoma sublateritium FD-334 SS-4]|uniref:Uncharacterized protein n=1 Tax=Hypholoma sublateritium (strain FD-334 SS-4) TaxID=945553 RepID=A0A0D2P5R1_HYPSF|nr:hypothetical protein HYPSUDRAFT_36512 [Hypholoma sublateritium FD-334 SS-4]